MSKNDEKIFQALRVSDLNEEWKAQMDLAAMYYRDALREYTKRPGEDAFFDVRFAKGELKRLQEAHDVYINRLLKDDIHTAIMEADEILYGPLFTKEDFDEALQY